MPLSILFWVIYLVALLFGIWGTYGQPDWPRRAGGNFALWVLVGILGYRVFGSAIR